MRYGEKETPFVMGVEGRALLVVQNLVLALRQDHCVMGDGSSGILTFVGERSG